MDFIDDLLFLYSTSRSRLVIIIFILNKIFGLAGIKYRLNKFPARRFVVKGIPYYVNTLDGLCVLRVNHETAVRDALYSILSQEESGGIFINVGAHIGKYALGLAQYFDRTIAFEPTPKTLELLSKASHENPYSSRIELHNLCISDSKGRRVLALNKSESQNAILPEGSKGREGDHAYIEVETNTLDEVISPSEYSKVRLLLIDVEGAETCVLAGAQKILLESNTAIIVEILGESSLLKCKNLLCQFGYSITILDNSNYLFSKGSPQSSLREI